MAWFRTESDKAETADARILNMFVVLKGWFESEGFHGCAFINTAGEIGDPNDPIRLIAKLHKQKLFDYTLELCEQLNIEHPSALAKQLLILMEGAITMARVMGISVPPTAQRTLRSCCSNRPRPSGLSFKNASPNANSSLSGGFAMSSMHKLARHFPVHPRIGHRKGPPGRRWLEQP